MTTLICGGWCERARELWAYARARAAALARDPSVTLELRDFFSESSDSFLFFSFLFFRELRVRVMPSLATRRSLKKTLYRFVPSVTQNDAIV